jgi:hypothetical protein
MDPLFRSTGRRQQANSGTILPGKVPTGDLTAWNELRLDAAQRRLRNPVRPNALAMAIGGGLI